MSWHDVILVLLGLADPASLGVGGVVGFVLKIVLERLGVVVVPPLQFASSSSNRRQRRVKSPPSD